MNVLGIILIALQLIGIAIVIFAIKNNKEKSIQHKINYKRCNIPISEYTNYKYSDFNEISIFNEINYKNYNYKNGEYYERNTF